MSNPMYYDCRDRPCVIFYFYLCQILCTRITVVQIGHEWFSTFILSILVFYVNLSKTFPSYIIYLISFLKKKNQTLKLWTMSKFLCYLGQIFDGRELHDMYPKRPRGRLEYQNPKFELIVLLPITCLDEKRPTTTNFDGNKLNCCEVQEMRQLQRDNINLLIGINHECPIQTYTSKSCSRITHETSHIHNTIKNIFWMLFPFLSLFKE